MEKTVNDFSVSLLVWQAVVGLVLLAIVYYLVRLYKKVNKYLDKKD